MEQPMIISHHGVTPQISETAYIPQSAHIIGDVHIGPESSVWFNAVVRGDVCYIRIGARQYSRQRDGARV